MILNLLPFIFLLLTILVIVVVTRLDVQVGGAWLILAIGTLLAAVSVFVLKWVEVPMLEIENWLSIAGSPITLRFGFDDLSWQFSVALLAMLIGIVFTMPVRLDVAYRPQDWVFDLLFILVGLLPVMAQNLLSLVIAWTLLDFLELSVHISGLTPERINRQAVMAFALRVGGSWILILAQLLSRSGFQGEIPFAQFESISALLLLLAAGLRLGIFPVFLPFQNEAPIRRELGAIMRFVVPASSLILLTRLSEFVIPSGWAIALSFLALAAALVGALLFFFSESALMGRNYWTAAFSALAVVSVVRAQTDAALVWSLALLFSGTFLSMHSEKRHGTHYILVIAMFLSLCGIPFTPTAFGVQGLIVLPFNLLDILFILVYTLLLIGFLRQETQQETAFGENTSWMKLSYWFGLILLMVTFWFISIPSLERSLLSSVWWGGIPAFILSLTGFYALYRFAGVERITLPKESTLANQLQGESILYRLIENLFLGLKSFVHLVMGLLEGDAAILWIFLLFLMMMTMVLQGGGA